MGDRTGRRRRREGDVLAGALNAAADEMGLAGTKKAAYIRLAGQLIHLQYEYGLSGGTKINIRTRELIAETVDALEAPEQQT